MTHYCAACFPKLSTHDAWIREFRLKFDPKAQLVEPHLTLIFPTSSYDEAYFVSEVKKVASTIKKYSVTCRSAILMPERNETGVVASIFLVPDEGFSHTVKLHDRLYAGALHTSLRLDIPFVPHITIGSGLTLEHAKSEVDKINFNSFEVSFVVSDISLMAIDEDRDVRRLIASVELTR